MSVADYLDIDLNAQNLSVIRNGEVCRRFVVSTAKNGPGEQVGSECTPRGCVLWYRRQKMVQVSKWAVSVHRGVGIKLRLKLV